MTTYRLRSKVWLYPGMSGWHFVHVNKTKAGIIKKKHGSLMRKGAHGQAKRRGFGSLPVTVTLGTSSWKTSVFPDKKSGTYLLPLKAQIRKKEDVYADDTVSFSITIR